MVVKQEEDGKKLQTVFKFWWCLADIFFHGIASVKTGWVN